MSLPLLKKQPFDRSISPFLEMGAYEALWLEPKASFKSVAEKLSEKKAIASELVSKSTALKCAEKVLESFSSKGITDFGLRIRGVGDYPQNLEDAVDPLFLFYFLGWWDLAETRSVAVVGTRNPSSEGKSRAHKLAKLLVNNKFTVVSGLAKGIDTVAHKTAIEEGGYTIGVLGTPLHSIYPKENEALQKKISENFLLISQIPVLRYLKTKNPTFNRFFFPERNKTMSALSLATVIVEAGETSGTLVQARAAIKQNRKLFILNNCFENPRLTWPKKFEDLGAIRVRDFDQILEHLQTK